MRPWAGSNRRRRASFSAAEIAFTDSEVGRLVETIHARWPDERTLLVVTSDHGESRGEHGEITHAFTVYDATQQVPLLMSGPGLPQGKVVDAVVRVSDVAPTILGFAGLAPLPATDGTDLRAMLSAEGDEGGLAYVETLATQLELGWSPLLGVRSSRFKYIRAPRPELYDLGEDPGETRNLAGEAPEVVARLDVELEARLAKARPIVPTLEPDAAERERLQQLGYLVSPGTPLEGVLGRVGGPDPKDQMGLIRALTEGMRLNRLRRFSEALERVEALDAGGPAVELLRADLAHAAGEFEAAERYARAAIALARQRPDGYHVLGSAAGPGL
jgi:hypothetical protein